MRKRWLLLVIIALYAAMCACPGTDAATVFEGSGTREDPYLIHSPAELAALSIVVNAGHVYSDAYFLQAGDLDMDGVRMNPIGLPQSEVRFGGTYDGGGHVIRNLTMTGKDGIALFGTLSGTVMNLGLMDCDIESESRAAAIVFGGDEDARPRVYNCFATGRVKGLEAGGLVCDADGMDVQACWFDGEVEGEVSGGIYAAGDPSRLENVFAGIDSGLGSVPACPPEEMKGDAFVQEMNLAARTAMLNDDRLVRLCKWRSDGDRVVLSEERISLASVAQEQLALRQRQYVNEIFIALAAIIALAGLAVWLGELAARCGLYKGFAVLAAAYLVLLLAAWWISDNSQVLFKAERQPVWEGALMVIELMLLFNLSDFLLRQARQRRHRGRPMNAVTVYLALFAHALVFALSFIAWLGAPAFASLFYPDRAGLLLKLSKQLIANRTNQPGLLANYGPIGWVGLKVLSRLIPTSLYQTEDAAQTIASGTMTSLIAAALTILGAGGLALSTYIGYQDDEGGRRGALPLALSMAVTAPVLAAVADCDMSLLAAAAVLLFLRCNRSRERRIQALGPVWLAVATGLHPLAAVFGLLLLFGRRYKTLFLWLACCAATLAPVVLLSHGFGGLSLIARSFLERWYGAQIDGAMTRAFTVSFAGTLNTLAEAVSGNPTVLPACDVLGGVLFALLLCAAALNRGWRRLFCLALAACGASRGDTPAVLAFMAVPLVVFLRGGERVSRRERALIVFFFLCLFISLPTRAIDRLGNLQLWQYGAVDRPTLSALIRGVALLSAACAAVCRCAVARIQMRRSTAARGTRPRSEV